MSIAVSTDIKGPARLRTFGLIVCAQLLPRRYVRHYLRTFAPKSSYGEIFFLSRLELGHKVLTPKMKKKIGGHRLRFGENGRGKMP